MKRILVVSDMHCGHKTGLTPPHYQTNLIDDVDHNIKKHNKWTMLQRSLWHEFEKLIDKHQPYDLAFDLGDMIDGKGSRSGGTELITSDRDEQVDMSVYVHNHIAKKGNPGFKWYGVFGTAYHSSGDGGEDWESMVAEKSNFERIGSHEWVDVNGVVFDLKHHVGSSSVPYGRHTAVAKEKIWNGLWAEHGMQPMSSVILRGHVHYAAYCGGPGWVGMTLPALQGMGTKYGSRVCTGMVHWGVTIFDVRDDGTFNFSQHVVNIDTQKAGVIKA